jgi:hypothetical protein
MSEFHGVVLNYYAVGGATPPAQPSPRWHVGWGGVEGVGEFCHRGDSKHHRCDLKHQHDHLKHQRGILEHHHIPPPQEDHHKGPPNGLHRLTFTNMVMEGHFQQRGCPNSD